MAEFENPYDQRAGCFAIFFAAVFIGFILAATAAVLLIIAAYK